VPTLEVGMLTRVRLAPCAKTGCAWAPSGDTDLEVDHLHPASWNGADAAEDYVTACHGCNRAKRDRSAVPITKEQAIDALEFAHSIPRTRQPVGKARAFVPACGTTFGLDAVEDGRAAVCSLVNSLQRVAEVQAMFHSHSSE
jgi:hypothetical protein